MRGESGITPSIWQLARVSLLIPSPHSHPHPFWSLILKPRSSARWDIDNSSCRIPASDYLSAEVVSGESGITPSIWQLVRVSLLIPSSHRPYHWFWSSNRLPSASGSWDIDKTSSRNPHQTQCCVWTCLVFEKTGKISFRLREKNSKSHFRLREKNRNPFFKRRRTHPIGTRTHLEN